jgi:biopolymer transport protein ExbB/TolQ
MKILEILNAGGIFMYGILCCSIFSLGLILMRLFSLWVLFRLDTERLQTDIASRIRSGNFGEAVQLCSGRHPLQEMMRVALMRANRSEKEIRRAIETAAVVELARFRRGTASMPQLSNLATLLGLLGTIHGLIISFSGMQGADAATRQAALSKGVAVAFYNTFFGLTVATVIIIAYLIISAKQTREMTKMEHSMNVLVDHLLSSPDPRAVRPANGAAGKLAREA